MKLKTDGVPSIEFLQEMLDLRGVDFDDLRKDVAKAVRIGAMPIELADALAMVMVEHHDSHARRHGIRLLTALYEMGSPASGYNLAVEKIRGVLVKPDLPWA